MPDFYLHVFDRRFRFIEPLIRLLALAKDDLIARMEIFFRLRLSAQFAVFPNILQGCAAVLETTYALHPVEGLLIEYALIRGVASAGQQTIIRVEPYRVLRHAEHFRDLALSYSAYFPPKKVLTSSNSNLLCLL